MLPWLSSLTVGPVLVRRLRHRWSTGDYCILPLPPAYSDSSRSLAKQSLLHAVLLSKTISQEIYLTSYGRFRPNKDDPHLWRWCYRGGWHQSFPPLIRQTFCAWQKPYKVKHFGFPYHTCVHCKGFAPAAPRRARASISVPFSGLSLSRPLRIFGLVSRYLTNSLIRRRPILKHCF